MSTGKWDGILREAAEIVESYDTGVTLRQLFYRLVSVGRIPNKQTAYSMLSRYTAQARREGWFPPLVDRTRKIHQPGFFSGTEDARAWLSRVYRRDRTEGQEWTIYVGVEKHGIVNQLTQWFFEYGIPVLALGGYSSQTYVDEIVEHKERYSRPAVLIYAGDFDPSGEDIQRDFTERVAVFDEVVRIALTQEQVIEHSLPPQPGKHTDSRSGAFIAKYGELMQVELDALPPDTLKVLYETEVERFMDHEVFRELLDVEWDERNSLSR